ncbi:MAG: hypothetical protein A2283_08410 [Lentisphaerae bacterium RIFOXYA12_FULL_48_11]|nr:MAG: hypothetical protein A2283_08410 [Lentisphaerae bacterium RIFOXYA12_FULL_48_11]
MEDSDNNMKTGGSACSFADAEKLVRGMGLIFSNTFLYGPTHSVTRKAMDDCYIHLTELMGKCEEVVITVSDEGLVVEGHTIEQKNPLVRMFVTQIGSLEISTFSLTRGMTKEKFDDLMEVMNAKPEELKQLGGFVSVINVSGLDNIKVKKVTYRQVEEHEEIVDKTTVEKAAVADAAAKMANVAEIMAFLGGDSHGDQEVAIKAVQSVSSDSQQLADLIMQAAEIHKESSAIDDAKSFSKLVIDCLKRAYEGLLKDPSIKTQKGKKNLARTLLTLEEQMLKKMNDLAPGGLSDEDTRAITETIEEMNDELKIDSLTDEFIKKKSAAKASEERILKYLKKRGLENIDEADLKDKLEESGLSMDEWQEMLLKSGVRGGGGSGDKEGDDVIGVGSAVGHLAALLVKMEEKFAKKRPAEGGVVDAGEFADTLKEVDKEVTSLVVKAGRKIDAIVETVKADREAEKKGQQPSMPRAKLMEILAEAVQELCQPLAVINCSLDMMRSNVLGPVNPQQKEMLDLASSNGERVVTLVNKLMEISGVPKTLQPDAKIQSSLY